MLDLKFVRDHQLEVEQNVKHRKAKAEVAKILELDQKRTKLRQALDDDRAALNAGSKSKPDAETIDRLRLLGQKIKDQEHELAEIEARLQQAASYLPNMSSPDMPIGQGEADNVEVKVWIVGKGYVDQSALGKNDDLQYRQQLPKVEFETQLENHKRHHIDVAEDLGIVDLAQGAKVAGTRFAYLLGAAAQLENALIQLLSTKLLNHQFVWVDPPLLVREPVLFGTSHFPEGRDQVYQISTEHIEEGRDLFLVGSSEPALFAYGMDRVFEADQLPLKLFAVTPCFRSEVGSWGKDVRGIKRVHQFTKLEMDVICPPDQSTAIFDELLGYNEWLLQQLNLSYRVINKCSGDCGYLATYFQYDIEVWMPSAQSFMETMTDTNATDFQARRLNCKVKMADGGRELVHTVNDTGVALGRMVAAILDNYQQPDGSVVIPEVLRPWMGGQSIIKPNQLTSLTTQS